VADPDRRSEGMNMLRDSAALRERFLGGDDPRTREAQAQLAKAGSH